MINLALISKDPKAHAWAESLKRSVFAIKVCESRLDLVNESPDYVIFDGTGAGLTVNAYNLRDGNRKVYARFMNDEYDVSLYDELLKAGISGMLIGWPTENVLYHETLNRDGHLAFRHSRFGLVHLDQHSNLRIGESDNSVRLTNKESRLFQELGVRRGAVVTRGLLLDKVWNYKPDTLTHTPETHTGRLRKKIDGLLCKRINKGELIETLRGIGYKMTI